MIPLTKLNGERFLINYMQIERIEVIPETKLIMMNHDYFLVRESVNEVIRRIAEYTAKVKDIHREISVNDNRE